MSSETVKTISGKVHYLQRIALSPNSTLHVRLQDVSLQDVVAKELAVQIIPNAEKAGLNFNLTYSFADVLPGHTYAISASITHEDRLIFATTQHHRVELGADHVEEQEVLVSLV
ncbi:YbaY family lipoprotein [Pseudomonas baetica]|uniref:YbaY family lipoprotein n=1 Tax=Pseudomonas baetica TaxID=674054 RepID=UPI0024068DDD|nr:YbaY family lipoprotein [Pseudomonas baetica]MDF9777135.1 putative lipoprotein [Pseudomonas baetica]